VRRVVLRLPAGALGEHRGRLGALICGAAARGYTVRVSYVSLSKLLRPALSLPLLRHLDRLLNLLLPCYNRVLWVEVCFERAGLEGLAEEKA
jgi:hypothetical protein